jgi:GT2 family glycosyltransferase
VSARIAVCISTRDRAARLRRLLAALERQQLEPADLVVVIVDDGSVDETPAVLAEATRRGAVALTTVRHDRSRGPAAGRNAAWRAATAPVIAFIDDDCVPSPLWLPAALRRYAADDADVVVGAVARAPAQAHRTGRFARELVVGPAQVRWFATANVFYRRDNLVALGGFDEGYRSAAAEDTDLGFRAEAAGLRVAFEPTALVFHDVTAAGVCDAIRDQARWADLARLFKSHPEQRRRTLHRRVFWRETHPELLLLAGGLALGRRWPAALALAAPWLHGKLCRERGEQTMPAAVAELPGALAVDVAELTAVVRGSIRHRTLLL